MTTQEFSTAIILVTLAAVIGQIAYSTALLIHAGLKKKRATQSARLNLLLVENKLQAEIMFAPEPYAPSTEHERYERECQSLREEMASIIEHHGIHPFDAVKPY